MYRPAISELTAFVAIAEQRSFRVAAEQLGISPSALSHTVRKLEARIGVRLFNRTTRSVALTDAGQQLWKRTAPVLADLEQAIDEAASDRDCPSGVIRISAAEPGARPLVQHVLPSFLKTYPDIRVEFIVDTRMVDIVANGYDAGIRLFEDVPRDMVAIRFGADFRMVAVASAEYLAQYGRPETPEDLRAHRCICFRFESGAVYHWVFARDGREMVVEVSGPMTLGNTPLMVEAAIQGIGIAWVPDYLVSAHVAAGRLQTLLADWCPSSPGPCLYYPSNRHPPTALRLFAEAVRAWATSMGAIHREMASARLLRKTL